MRRSAFDVALDIWLVLVLITRATSQDTDSCVLNFTQQPVTTINCDVYQSDLVLTCSVVSLLEADIADPNDVAFRWYFYNGTEYELAVGINHTRSGGNGVNVQVTSTLQISGTSQTAAYLSQGFYYCQVQMIDVNVMSNFSQRFQVLSQDEYIQYASSCSEKTFIDSVQMCAVYRVEEELLTTKTVTLDMMTPKTPDKGTTTLVTKSSSSPTSSTGDQTVSGSSGETLQVWIYVLVAVAAVFAMIIIILAIMCVGLCLRRSQTMDTNSLNKKENGGMHGNFISHSSSMVNNELYHGGNRGEETDFTTGTYFTSLSQIPDDNYNTLGERDYDVIVSRPCESNNSKQEYHRLQRPSPPAVPTGRNGMLGYSPPNGEFRSMSTLTSQMNGMDTFHKEDLHLTKLGYSTLPARPPPPAYNGDMHIYRELEKPATTLPVGCIPNGGIYHSPTDSSPPDSARYFERGDSTTALLPPLPPARGTGLRKGSSVSTDSSLNESLYNPVSSASLQHPHPLQKIPETGTIFADPPNPTAFPVNEYEYIPAITEYEKPVASKQQRKVGENPKTRVSTKSMNYETDPNLEIRANDVTDCTADCADMTGDSIMGFKLPLDNDLNANLNSVTGESDSHFSIGPKQDSTTISQERLSTGNFTGGSSTGGYMSSVLSADYIGASTDSLPSVNSNTVADFVEPKENLRLNGMCYPDNKQIESLERRSMSRERRSFSREAPTTSSHTSIAEKDSENHAQYSPDIAALPSHIVTGNTLHTPSPPPPALSSSTLPQSRPNPYQELDASSFKQHRMDHAKLQVEAPAVHVV